MKKGHTVAAGDWLWAPKGVRQCAFGHFGVTGPLHFARQLS